jgi:hypothetical protein
VLCCLGDVIPPINRFYVKIGHLLIVIFRKNKITNIANAQYFSKKFNPAFFAFAALQQSSNPNNHFIAHSTCLK